MVSSAPNKVHFETPLCHKTSWHCLGTFKVGKYFCPPYPPENEVSVTISPLSLLSLSLSPSGLEVLKSLRARRYVWLQTLTPEPQNRH
jgi:uncharacterized Zn-finger protein